MKLMIGTAGLVDSNKIDCVEIEFTYGVRINPEKAQLIKQISNKNDLSLSVHAPYYINLNSNEDEKVVASMKRIVDSALAANMIGARKIVFHPGFYMGKNSKDVYDVIRDRIVEVLDYMDDNNIDAELLPETTGKVSQFGSLNELVKLHDEIGLNFCVDFSHIKARSLGTLNYREIVDQISSFKKLHTHFSGIEYGNKGELRHLNVDLNESNELINAILNSPLQKVSMICESPNTYDDALKMIKQRNTIKY